MTIFAMKMQTIGRPVTLADVNAAARIHVDTWRTTYRGLIHTPYLDALSYDGKVAQWKQGIENKSPDIFRCVAEREGGILGIAIFGSSRDKERPLDSELYALYVKDEAQGSGSGYALWNRALELLREAGYSKMFINVIEGNTKGIGFYERQGSRLADHQSIELEGHSYPHRVYEFDLTESA